MKSNAASIEFALHGLGHEYWLDGKRKRAEWYCKEDKHPWPEDIMKEHLQCFRDIMAQYGIDAENGHSFPESFVPCSYSYYWNPDGVYSIGKIMSEAGVKYANTWFDEIRELNPPEGPNGGGFDKGLVVVNRLNYGNDWFEISKLPDVDIELQESDIIESHWCNWLAQDDFLQALTTQKWIDYYKMVQSQANRYIAKNTEQFHSQWLYNKYTRVKEEQAGIVEIDNTHMPEEYYTHHLLGNMVLKVKLNVEDHISIAQLENQSIACYFKDEGYGFIYLPMLKKKKYKLSYSFGNTRMPFVVYNDGTYNVYETTESEKVKTIRLRVYGLQEVKIYCDAPTKIESHNPNVRILESSYNEKLSLLRLMLSSLDIQGETGLLSIF